MAMAHEGSRPLYGNRRGGADQDRYLFWASGAKVPSGALVTAASGANYVMTKLVFGSPQYAIDHLRLHFSGFASTEGGNSPQETVLPGNLTVIDGVWVEVGGVAIRAKFGGTEGTSIASGANGAWTDDLQLASPIPAESLVTIYTLYHSAAGEKQIPCYLIEKHRGERVWGAASTAALMAMIGSSAASTAGLDIGYGGPSQPAYYGPDLMLAKGWDGRPVPLVVCDSVGERQTDYPQSSDVRRNKGWLRRWLDSDADGAKRIPAFFIGLPGASSARELSTSATKRWDVLDEAVAMNGGRWPFTCIVDQMGINDYQASYATMKSNWLGLVTRIRGRYANAPVIAVGQPPRTSASSDNYRTAGGQTDYVGTANYRLLDGDKAAMMQGGTQGFIDLQGAAYSASGGKWPAAPFTTSLSAPAGTDGTTPYGSIRIADEPMRGDVLRWGANGAQLGVVVDYSGAPGDWLVTFSTTNTVASAVGTTVFAPSTFDGVHPWVREILRMAAAVPQSDKAKLL